MAGYAQQGSPEVVGPISKLKLDLKIIAVANGVATSFTLEGKDHDDKKHVSNRKITIPAASRNVELEFHLEDDSGNNLEYCQADPMWVSRTDMCPQTQSSDPQINAIQASKSKLTATDLNTDTVDLGYTIVLEGDCGRVLVDPIIRNEA